MSFEPIPFVPLRETGAAFMAGPLAWRPGRLDRLMAAYWPPVCDVNALLCRLRAGWPWYAATLRQTRLKFARNVLYLVPGTIATHGLFSVFPSQARLSRPWCPYRQSQVAFALFHSFADVWRLCSAVGRAGSGPTGVLLIACQWSLAQAGDLFGLTPASLDS